MRILAVISDRGGVVGKTKHYVGFPPDLTQGMDTRRELGPAVFLVIEEKPDGVFLYRYGPEGVFAGDTWHTSVDDAKHQAKYEYGDSVRDWQPVPSDTSDVVSYGLLLAKS